MFKKASFFMTGVALVIGQIAPAQAQLAPGAGSPEPAVRPAAREAIAIAPDGFSQGGVRAVRRGDNDRGVMTLDDYLQRYPQQGEAGFRRIQQENAQDCAKSGEIVRKALMIASKAQAIDGDLYALYGTIYKLGKKQNTAFLLNAGAQVVSGGALCALSAGLYCLAAGVGALGNLFQSGAHKATQKVDRQMRIINTDQSRLQIEGMLLNMEATIYWAEVMQDYCLITHPNATLGTQPADMSRAFSFEPAPRPEFGRRQ
jgi:hypothetical protein